LKVHKNAKFKNKDFLDTLSFTAQQTGFVNLSAKSFKEVREEGEVPSGDLIMYHFSKFESIEEIRKIFDNILDITLGYAKKNYNIFQTRKLNIAYDVHSIPYYGKRTNPYVCGGKPDRGTAKFFNFLSCSIVEGGRRFIVDAIPICQIDDISKLMDISLTRIKERISIGNVYCDRGFNRVKIFRVLKKHKVKFLMPMVRNPKVKRLFDEAIGFKAKVFNNFRIGEKENSEEVNVTIVDDSDGVKHAFVCNFEVKEEEAQSLYSLYGKRWGIETSFRTLEEDMRLKTTSRNYHIRLFYFLFSCCLYNFWILANICVSLALYGRIKEKPVVEAKLFILILAKVQSEYIDTGG